MYHDTGNPNSTAQHNVDYYKNTYMQDWDSTASAHFFVDDKECIICVPLDEKHGTFYTIHQQITITLEMMQMMLHLVENYVIFLMIENNH